MATIYWAGAIDTDIDDYRNYVTGANADPASATIADNSGDFSGDDVVFQSLALSNVARNPTVNANETFNAIKIDSGCTLTGNASYSITVDSESDFGVLGALHAVYIAGTLGTNVNVIIACAVVTSLQLNGSSGNLHNVTVSAGSSTHYMVAAATIAGNLTITSGTLTTGSDYALTVADVVTVNGILTGNGSTLLFGSLKGTGTFNAPTTTVTIDDRDESTGKALDIDGMTIATNDLNVNITSAKNQDLDIGDDKIHDLTINQDTDARINYLLGNCSIDGDLTITRGILNTFNRTLTVDGDCSIAADGKLEASVNGNVAVTLGSLTIASGGTYNATSATTKITSEAGSGYCIQNAGTFTHNKGLVEIDFGAGITEGQNGPYWDLLLSDPDTDFYTANTWVIYNNFDLVGDFDVQNNAHHITVHGNMTIGDGSTTTRYMNATAHTNNLTVGGTLHITNGATADLGTHGTVNVGGIRNTGGSIS